MSATSTSFRVPGLSERRIAELATHARRLGLSPQRYARQLIENGLALEREARTKSFDEILAPLRAAAQPIDEDELDQLVDQARTRHHRKAKKKGR